MSGIAQYSQLGTFSGSVSTSAPVPSDFHSPAIGDTFGLNGLWNESTWDRQRNNTYYTILALLARTGNASIPQIENINARGIQLILRVTAASGTGGLTLYIQSFDHIAGAFVNLVLAPAAVLAAGYYIYELYPGISGLSGQVVQRTSGVLPRKFGLMVNHGDSSSYTYSLGYSLIL